MYPMLLMVVLVTQTRGFEQLRGIYQMVYEALSTPSYLAQDSNGKGKEQ